MKNKLSVVLLGAVCLCLFGQSDGIAVMSIDIGSEWMKIAIVKPGVPMEIVLNKESKRKTEVAVAFDQGDRYFGSSAVTKGVRLPKTTFLYLQELLAKSLDNPIVQRYQKRFPYHNIEEDPETGTIVFVNKEENFVYSPEELVAMVLNYSRSLAEEYAQQPIDTCVITVPAFFNQAERKALMYSAKLAGLKVSQLMDDHTAAALNYGVFRRHDINSTASYILFYDMGASSTVASVMAYQVLKVNGITDPQLSVKGIGHDRELGGVEMEFRLRDHLVKLFNEKKKTKSDVTQSPRAMAKLLKEAKRVMKVLSANVDHMAQIEGLIDEEDFRARVTREDFQDICQDLWERVPGPINQALKAADMTMDSISQVLLVGGGTRIPKVQEMLLKASGKSELGKSINADEAAALGASYQAAALSNAFKVKTFHVKSGAVYPVEIDFDRYTQQEDGTTSTKHIKRTLFQRSNPYPQRKVITFNRFYDNFNFSVSYGDVSFLSEEEQKIFGTTELAVVEIEGLAAIHEKYSEDNSSESKGVKAHFRMDESGILNLESVEAVYEVNKTVEENATDAATEESTLQKIKDGISSFFGGGDTDNDTKSTDDKEKQNKTEETKTDEAKEKETAKVDEKSTEDKNETKTVSKVVKVKKSEILDHDISVLDHKNPSAEHEEKSATKLKALADRDEFKLARETAMNKLESYIYDKRDKLYLEEYEEALTEQEQEDISAALDAASEWMDDIEGEPPAEEYKEKLKLLKDATRPWLTRVKLRKENIPLLEELESLFNYTIHFVSAVKMLPEDDQIYTEVEIKTITDLIASTVEWKNETLAKENALKPYEDPVLKPDDIKQKFYELNREIQYLYNKAKTAKPKKPKVSEKTKKGNETASNKAEEAAANKTATDEGATSESPPEEEPPVVETPQIGDADATDESNYEEATEEPTEESSEKPTSENTSTDAKTETTSHEDHDKQEL
uniref:Hypoxia up-regulated protein 1 n=1 Tax=Phallusia mammillata TaxID=59560 RepID=A0A6F9DE94_9ASCI|nr:hypoxia up-regulated protein 1-like [Phallusia mammillata]